MKNSFRELYVWKASVELAVRRGSLYELETQLEVIVQARLARDTSGVRTLIAQIGTGLTRMIEFRDQRSL